MPNVREIRRRIKSVQNTAKITKAMSMIAASKMRRAQEMALNTRPYSERLFELLENVSEDRSEEHTSELQSLVNLVCRLLLEKKNNN